MIEIKKVSKKYGNFMALDNLSFKIQKGEVLGFLGPNGAGKTTTMKMITCFMPPTSGHILVDGYDTIESSIEVRRKIGYLPESAPLYKDMEVRDYLKFVGQMREIKSSLLKEKISNVVDICNLGEKLRMPIGTLSKGYRQRVGLAQALIHDPEILILDEPTSGLDPNQIIEIRNLIKTIGKEKTVILSTHILPEVSATCSRVIIVNKGKMVAEGNPETLVSNAKGEEIISTKISGTKATMEKELNKIKHVSSVEVLPSEKKGMYEYIIRGEKEASTDLRKDIFNAVVKNKCVLYEMKIDSLSLEDVFINLTNVEETEIKSIN